MNVSDKCVNMIKHHEGFVRKPYQDPIGLWTVGVARWSTYMNVLPQNINNMNDVVIGERLEKSKEKLKQSQPDFIIETLDELPNIIETINTKG